MITAKEMEAKRTTSITDQMESDLEALFRYLSEYNFTDLYLNIDQEHIAYPTLSNLDSEHLSMIADYLKDQGYSITLFYNNSGTHCIHVTLPNPSHLPCKFFPDVQESADDTVQSEHCIVKDTEPYSLWDRLKQWIGGGK